MEKYYTTKEVAEKLGVHRNTLTRLVKKHEIKVLVVGNQYRYSAAEVRRLKAALRKTM